MKQKPVFCKECRYFDLDQWACAHPENRMFCKNYYTWEYRPKNLPGTLNGNNDCTWFEGKESFFKRLFS